MYTIQQFFNYCTHNKNKIKGSPKARVKAKVK